MKKTLVAASLTALMSVNAQADTLLGLYLGGQVWANQADGSFGEGGTNQAVTNFNDETQGSFFIALEHPIPLIPNIKIASTALDTVGNAAFNGSFDFGGNTYDTTSNLATTFDASYVDYTFYYELFDNDLLSFDFGLTARDLDSQIKVVGDVSGVETNSELSVSGIIPLVYVNTIIGLPFTGVNVFAEANFLSFDDQTIYDYQIGVSYELLDNLAVDIDLTVGYRAVKLELDDLDNLYTDIDFKGVFAGVIVHF